MPLVVNGMKITNKKARHIKFVGDAANLLI